MDGVNDGKNLDLNKVSILLIILILLESGALINKLTKGFLLLFIIILKERPFRIRQSSYVPLS